MKNNLLSLLSILSFIYGFGQEDSVRLKLSYRMVGADSNHQSNIRVDFISKKMTPVFFYNEPIYMLMCEKDDIGLVSERLEGDCFTSEVKSDCHEIVNLKQKPGNYKQLLPGDTSTYSSYISLMDKDHTLKTIKGFTGNYRFRVYRYYTDDGKRKRVFSNWIYVNYP